VVKFVALVLSLPGIVIVATWIVGSRFVFPLVETVAGSPLEESIGRDERCMSSTRFDDAWAERCTWNPESAGAPIYLIGDSTATHFDEGLVIASAELDRPLSIWNGILCLPFNSVTANNDEGRLYRDHCARYQEFINQRLVTGPPGTVVIGFSDLTQWFPDVTYVLADGTSTNDPREKGQAIEFALADYITELESWGHTVVTAYPVPNFRHVGPGFSPRMCTLWELLDDTCAPRVDRGEMLELQAEVRESVTNAAQKTGTATIDLFDQYCDDAVCSPSRDGLLVYHDDTHITAAESRALAPELIELLRNN
jgi:hypothetical protein